MVISEISIDDRSPDPAAPVLAEGLNIVGPEHGTHVTQRHRWLTDGLIDRIPRLAVPVVAAVRLDV
jgi:hypothetical protein